MKGQVELKIDSAKILIARCRKFINTPVKGEVRYEYKFSWKHLKKIRIEYKTVPYWYADKDQLNQYLNSLQEIIYSTKSVTLSLLCYENLLKLSNRDNSCNSTYILYY